MGPSGKRGIDGRFTDSRPAGQRRQFASKVLRIYPAAVLILCLPVQLCAAASPAKKDVKKGNTLYNEEDFEGALEKYTDAFAKSPDSDIVNYNLGAALYKTGDYEAAVNHFEKTLVSGDASLEQKASYNLGNAEYKFGIGQEDSNLQNAVNLLKQSVRHYRRAVELDADDGDAKHNQEFVGKELKRLEEKLKQRQEKRKEQQRKKEGEQEKSQGQTGGEERAGQQKEEASQKGQSGEQKKEASRKEQDAQQKKEAGEEEGQQTRAPQGQKRKPQEDGGGRKAGTRGDAAGAESARQMSEEEARMLLESYRGEEEPRGLFRQKMPVSGLPEPSRDW